MIESNPSQFGGEIHVLEVKCPDCGVWCDVHDVGSVAVDLGPHSGLIDKPWSGISSCVSGSSRWRRWRIVGSVYCAEDVQAAAPPGLEFRWRRRTAGERALYARFDFHAAQGWQ